MWTQKTKKKNLAAAGCRPMHITHHRVTLIILVFSPIFISKKNFSNEFPNL